MSEWKTVRLGDIFDLQMGKTPDRKKIDYFQGFHKWISIADISKSEKYISETKECLSDEAITSSGIKSIPKDTLIMSFKLSIGKTAITSDEMYSNEAIMAFLPNGKCETDNSFLYHLFSNKDWSEGSNKAVKGITLNKASLSEAKIPLPPLEEQKHIAAVLDKCTALIAKHKHMLEKYDTLIKSRFIEMFGDPLSNPKEWKKKELQELVTDDCTISYGIVQTGENQKEGIKVFRPIDIVNRKPVLSELIKTTEEISNKYKKTLLIGRELLITVRANIGDTCVIGSEFKGCNVGRGIVPIRTNERLITLEFLKNQFDTVEMNRYVKSLAKGITLIQLNMEDLRKINLIVPPLELQNEYTAFVQQIDKSKFAVQKSLEKAETLYKSLMQEYFG